MHVTGINGREYMIVDGLTLKERNAERKRLEGEGWTISTHGSNKRGWELRGWKGEAPFMTSHAYDLRNGGPTVVTPYYRDGSETVTIDGKPRTL